MTANSERDLELLKRMHDSGVLVHVEPNRMDLGHGVIAIPCSDGDQFFDVYHHLDEVCKGGLDRSRIHPLALNGGVLGASEKWFTPEESIVFLRHSSFATLKKGFTTIVLYSHSPCGIAANYNIELTTQVEHFLSAKRRLKNHLPHIQIVPFWHVHWGGELRRTYKFDRLAWERLMRSNAAQLTA